MPLGWFLLCLAGFGMLAVYQNTAAPQSDPSRAAQAVASRLLGEVVNHHSDTFYFFLHPKCSCSKASLKEAERVLLSLPDASSIRLEAIVFTSSAVAADQKDWRFGSDLNWKITLDEDGEIARRFGIETSGHAVVADGQGQILFSGGVTASRGHRGANSHSALLNDVLSDRAPRNELPVQTPVYGCSIL